MQTASLAVAFVLAASAMAVGCQGSPSSSSASSATPAKSASPLSATSPAGTAGPAADVKPAATSAAAAFPATALPSKSLAAFTIGVPPGGKLAKGAGDASSLETADYRLMIKPAKKDELATLKSEIKQMPGFKAITVDQPDGMVVEVDDKGKKEFLITRYIKLGTTLVDCSSALTKTAKDEAKAKEAFDVCGTIKQK